MYAILRIAQADHALDKRARAGISLRTARASIIVQQALRSLTTRRPAFAGQPPLLPSCPCANFTKPFRVNSTCTRSHLFPFAISHAFAIAILLLTD